MRRRNFIGFIGGAAVSLPLVVQAQQPVKKKRIANVSPIGTIAEMRADPNGLAFYEELKLNGYAEGINLIIDRYSAEGRTDRYDDLVREVVSTNPDLIWCVGTPLTLRFKAATSTIPIVTMTGDPIRFGIVSSIARPGGNVTASVLMLELKSGESALNSFPKLCPSSST